MKQTEFADKLINSLIDNKDCLHIVTVYDKPIDYPDNYVARLSLVKNEVTTVTDIMVVTETFKGIGDLLPPHHFCWIDRYPNDDPYILGTWI